MVEKNISRLNTHLLRNSQTRLLLGSASPRRKRIIEALGLACDCIAPVAEEIHDKTDPAGTVTANALTKHAWCSAKHPERWIITADTVVELNGVCLGKPADPAEAHDFLRAASGQAQQVFTAVALSRPGCHADLRITASSLTFRQLSDEDIQNYLTLATPYDRAGAYDVDSHGYRIIQSTCGSFTNIMGLPAETVADWLVANSFPAPVTLDNLPFFNSGDVKTTAD